MRISVFRGNTQLDVSMPSDRPVIEVIDDVVVLMAQHHTQVEGGASIQQLNGVEPYAYSSSAVDSSRQDLDLRDAHTWVLSSPQTGIIEADDTLAQHNILDGSRLFLTSRVEAAGTPFADDAMDEIRTTLADNQWRWSGKARENTAYIIASIFLILGFAFGAFSLEGSGDLQTWNIDQSVAATQVGVSGLLLTILSFMSKGDWKRWLGLGLPSVTLVIAWHVFKVFEPVEQTLFAIAVVALASVVTAWISGRRTAAKPYRSVAGIIASLCVSLSSLLIGLSVGLGASLLAIAAWTAWLPVVLLMVSPRIALSTTGLPTLLRRSESGNLLKKNELERSALRSESITRGLAWFATLYGFGVSVVLAQSNYWQQGIIALLLSIVLALRSNGFSDSRIIAPLMFSGFTGVTLAIAALLQWFDHDWKYEQVLTILHPEQNSAIFWWVLIGVSIAFFSAIVAADHWNRDELAESKIAQFLSIADVVSTLSLVPIILIGQGVFFYLWSTT